MRPGNCEQLNKVQRKCKALFLGIPTTACLEALEVEAGVVPLDLRREDLAVGEITKIMTKFNGQKIAEGFQTWRSQDKIMFPFPLAYMQLNETISNTGIDIKAVEPEFSCLLYFQLTKERPEYWNNLGSFLTLEIKKCDTGRRS